MDGGRFSTLSIFPNNINVLVPCFSLHPCYNISMNAGLGYHGQILEWVDSNGEHRRLITNPGVVEVPPDTVYATVDGEVRIDFSVRSGGRE